MTSLSNDNQSDIIEAFNSTSRYLDDLLNIDIPYFEGMVNQIYVPGIYPFLMVLFPPKFMINAMTLILIL